MSVAQQTPAPGGTALTPRQQKAVEEKGALNSVRDLLQKAEAQLAMALPKGIPASYMIRVVLTAVQRTPELLECAPITLLGAVFQAAQLGLVPDGVLGQAYLVPYRNRKKNRKEVQFIPGYRGLITLTRRSGELSTIDAEVVYAKDIFVYERGTNPTLKHVPSDEADPGPMVKVWATARLKDGGFQIVVLNARQVNAIRERSQAAGSEYSPWTTDPAWMWKKTALKQVCKLLPVSTETQRALALDDRAESGLPQDLALLADEQNETPTIDDGDVIEGEPSTPEAVIAAELQCDPARAVAVLRGFDVLNMPPAARTVQLKKFQGNADGLLQQLREMSGEPLAVGETFKEIAETAAAASETKAPVTDTKPAATETPTPKPAAGKPRFSI